MSGSGRDSLQLQIDGHLGRGMEELLRAHDYARGARVDPWEFAVGIESLERVGLSESDLRCLLIRDLVQHGEEISEPADEKRRFRKLRSLILTPRTCFVLTRFGTLIARQRLGIKPGPADACRNEEPPQVVRPRWIAGLRELWLGEWLIKRYRCPCTNQETLLAAFQEEGWPAIIDDPIVPKPGADSKRRLHDTIKNLNRNQINRFVRFRGDGTGQRARWECRDSWPGSSATDGANIEGFETIGTSA